MELVVDANIVISALIASEGRTCDLLFNDRLTLFAPDYLHVEINKHKKEILIKSSLSEPEFDLALSLISSRISFTSYADFNEFIPGAKTFSPDVDDTEYFALALKLKCALWSNDKLLKSQNQILVYSTKEILEMKI